MARCRHMRVTILSIEMTPLFFEPTSRASALTLITFKLPPPSRAVLDGWVDVSSQIGVNPPSDISLKNMLQKKKDISE